MSILRFLDEARSRTLGSSDASDLRRNLRDLPTSYRASTSAKETNAGYAVGERRLITLRNEAALATIHKKPDYRDRILDMIAGFIAEATVVLRPENRFLDSDMSTEPDDRAHTRPVPFQPFENVGGRIPAKRWVDTAQQMR